MKKLLLILTVVMAFFIAGCGSNPLEETGMNDEQIKVTEKAFKDSNLGEIKNIEKSVQGDNLYIARTDKYDGLFIKQNDDKSLKYISYEGRGLWDNGEKQAIDIEDIYVDLDAYTKYQTKAQIAVKERLKSPSTADFDQPSVQRNKDYVRVIGDVHAQNSFGALIKTKYLVEIKNDQVTSVIFDE